MAMSDDIDKFRAKLDKAEKIDRWLDRAIYWASGIVIGINARGAVSSGLQHKWIPLTINVAIVAFYVFLIRKMNKDKNEKAMRQLAGCIHIESYAAHMGSYADCAQCNPKTK